jgi:hypothetical protein
LAVAVVASAAHGAAYAQATALAPGQVSGAELQAWFDADGLAVGGINLGNGCTFVARGAGSARSQSIHCPTMAPFTVKGEAKVAGNQLCSKFVYPDGSVLDRCQDVFKVGENKYEFRFGGQVMTVVYRLVR